METWDDVVAIAKRYPAVEETTSWRTPSLKVAGRFLARLRTEADGALAIACDPSEKAALLASGDEAFFTTPHYDGYNLILIDLAKVERARLTELIEDAWSIKAPAKVRRAREQASG
ncbi:MmcQ/YjbR family DNA-binding protein [Glycomyces xiaoerkulensis]|uniref:MmcQ/YjbR family DNA-binding protein n=1 Tax=Glycomyces xiaoerkulensis TaxID=2038139 RepID=UPI000C2570AD|nr:MmcQ/YjbR family DNA-binding protein [Glycomyces xiaoerkulensis]